MSVRNAEKGFADWSSARRDDCSDSRDGVVEVGSGEGGASSGVDEGAAAVWLLARCAVGVVRNRG